MFKSCEGSGLWRIVFVLLEVSVFLNDRLATSILIAKSDLILCDSVGKNPHNVVDNKSCQKKLIMAQAVRAGQVRNNFFLVFYML